MYTLTTLYALRQHLGLEADDTSDDQRLLDALQAASATIERHTRRAFQPRLASIAHDLNLRDVRELLLKDDLLTLQSITNGDGSSITNDDVIQVADSILRLTNGNAFTYDETPVASILVTGIWGYHPNWAQAWADSGDTVQDVSLSDSTTSITVTDADAGTALRFQVGQLLRIDDEYLHITAIDTSTNILTVKRGVNGTVASSHSNGTSIEVYQMPHDVSQLTLRWALWLYREPDNFATQFPPMLEQSLQGLRRVSVLS
ncbi:MAG: hypothetical protein AAFV93_03870 [Chloroflexota bacterium]